MTTAGHNEQPASDGDGVTIDNKQRLAVIDNIIENYLYRDSQLVLAFQSRLIELQENKIPESFSKSTWEIIYILCRGLYSGTDVAASDIYSSIGISKTAVIRYLNRLESRGLVNKESDLKDKRRKLLKFSNDFGINITTAVDHCVVRFGGIIDNKTPNDAATVKQDLQEHLIKFREFAESSFDWFWETDKDHRFTWFSKRQENFPKFKLDGKLGMRRFDYIKPASATERKNLALHRENLGARKPFRAFIFRVVLDNGNEAWCAINGNPKFDADGVFQGYFGSGRDVTDRRRLIEDLRRSETQLREFNDLAADVSWVLDNQFKYKWYSKGRDSMSSRPLRNMLGELFWERAIPENGAGGNQGHEIQRVMDTHQPFYDVLIRYISGPEWNVNWHFSSGFPIFDSEGKFEGYQGICRDATKQIRTDIMNETKIEILSELVQGNSNAVLLQRALGIIDRLRPGTAVGLYVCSNDKFKLFAEQNNKSADRTIKIAQALSAFHTSTSLKTDGTITRLHPNSNQNLFKLQMEDKSGTDEVDIWVNIYNKNASNNIVVLAVEIEKNSPFGRDETHMIKEVRDLIGHIFEISSPDKLQNVN